MGERHRALVVGIDTPIGLTVIRELGEHGVEVHGIAFDRDAVGLHSKWLASGHRSRRTSDHLVDTIERVCATHSIGHVMAISESDIVFLNTIAERLSGLHLLIPSADQMARVLDKTRTYAIAREVGIDVPRTWTIEAASEINARLREITFPVVLKWPDPQGVRSLLRTVGLPLIKLEYCHSAAELRDALGRYVVVGRFPMVQSRCPGYGLGQMALMYNDKAILRFQHRRLHEWPPEGGGSTLCRSMSLACHPELFKRSVRLLRRLNWLGPAMIEYRYDPASSRAVLMEVNGRFWGSLPLAHHAGAHFAWWTYAALAHGMTPTDTSYIENLTCQFVVPDARRLFTILFSPGRIQDRSLRFDKLAEIRQSIGSFLRPNNRYYVWSWRDPWPAIRDLGAIARKVMASIWRR